MTKAKKSEPQSKAVKIEMKGKESEAETMARALTGPFLRHGVVSSDIATKLLGKIPGSPGFDDFGKAISAKADAIQKGDLVMANEMLTAQAVSLDALFAELARRGTMNLGEYPLAAERYMRLAFKAQANSRATLEALTKLHQPRVQTVRHVHVNEGGQAVVTDNFHHHEGVSKNDKTDGQPHATGAIGKSPALSSPDPLGNGVPIPGDKRTEKMPDARGKG